MMLPALPILDALPALTRSLEERSNAVLVAPPGAGKTTVVPLILLEAPWRNGGKILMLEPRRLAARAAATRMAALLSEMVGETAGYRTRLDSAVGESTLIEVVTDGLLVRRLQRDPGLDGVACVIFDEVHERGLDADLALAFCLDLQNGLRPELRLLAMSATADGARLAKLMDAPVIESAGRVFTVECQHARRDIAEARALPEAMASAIRAALLDHAGDILAFLPGMSEIRRTAHALDGCGALVLPLHGDLPGPEQDRALRAAETRRIVLATSIAETSLTVPGIRVVVDGGWRRTPRLDLSTGLTRLATVRISRAAALQRAGRAGREAPGVAIRLWSEALHRGLPAFDRPAILEAELSGLALDCAAWGAAPLELPFADPPPAGALQAATALLVSLGAVDSLGRITDPGRKMARLGAHPRLAAMMLAGTSPGEASLAAELASLLEERDPLRHAADVGITSRLDAIRHGAPNADKAALDRIRQAARHYRRRLGTTDPPSGDPGALLAAAFPDRIAQGRGEPGSFRLSGGGAARLPSTDRLSQERLVVVASLEQKTSARIMLAARLDPDGLPPWMTARVTEGLEHGFDIVSGAIFSGRRRRYGALVLEDRIVEADPEAVAATLAGVLAKQLDRLPWTTPCRQLQARAAMLHSLEPGFPAFSDAALADTVHDWLARALQGIRRLDDVAGMDLLSALRTRLSWEQSRRLDDMLPNHLKLPGTLAPIDYTGPVPTASARAQAFYGLQKTPALAGGMVPLQLVLLSPAGRPIAVTSDLQGFWRGAWADARKDMRGRYPKHDWPEAPG